jgi:hypothetical protein
VREARRLLCDRARHGRVRVTDRRDADAREEVQPLASIRVVERATARGDDLDRARRVGRLCDVGEEALAKPSRFGSRAEPFARAPSEQVVERRPAARVPVGGRVLHHPDRAQPRCAGLAACATELVPALRRRLDADAFENAT